MGAPKGNTNSKGKPKAGKGTGRKSAYQERLDAARLHELINRKYSREELRKLVGDDKAKLDVLERMLIKAHTGDGRLMAALFNKAFPDKLIAEMSGEAPKLVIFDM